MEIKFKQALVTIILTLGMSSIIFAQTVAEAGEELNKAIKLNKEKKYQEAAKTFEKAYKMAEKVGPEADKIKSTAKAQITNSYYKDAVVAYKAKKYEESISKFNVTQEMASKYEDEKLGKKSKAIIPQLYFALGMQNKKENKMEDAIENFNKALELKKGYAKAYLGKIIVFKEMNNEEEMMEAYKQIKTSKKGEKSIKKADKIVEQYYLKNAKNQYDAKKNDEALKTIEKYNELNASDPLGTYLSALIYNANYKYKTTIELLTDIEKVEDKDIKSNLYFELGNAYLGLKNNTKACESYKKAVSGPNAKLAEYQLKEVLKCK